MVDHPRKAPPNPAFTLLLAASILFVVTALAYLASPTILDRARANPGAGPGPASRALADWLDRRGPLALGVEFGVMVLASGLAMAADRRPGTWRRNAGRRDGG